MHTCWSYRRQYRDPVAVSYAGIPPERGGTTPIVTLHFCNLKCLLFWTLSNLRCSFSDVGLAYYVTKIMQWFARLSSPASDLIWRMPDRKRIDDLFEKDRMALLDYEEKKGA